MNITYGTIEQGRAAVRAWITEQRAVNPGFRVIDIGGVAGGSWSSDLINMCVDINAGPGHDQMAFDVCRPSAWAPLLTLVEEQGLYDYAICNHTLEDLYDPFVVLDLLPKIARAGIITTPSIRTELAHLPESPEWLGYYHHRWLFDQEADQIMVLPKLGLLEGETGLHTAYDSALQEIRYEWEGGIAWRTYADNYLAAHQGYVTAVQGQTQQMQLKTS